MAAGKHYGCAIEDPGHEDEGRSYQLNARVSHFHARLSPALRRTFQLRHVDGLTICETAQILGVPCGTVFASISRQRSEPLPSWIFTPFRAGLPLSNAEHCALLVGPVCMILNVGRRA